MFRFGSLMIGDPIFAAGVLWCSAATLLLPTLAALAGSRGMEQEAHPS